MPVWICLLVVFGGAPAMAPRQMELRQEPDLPEGLRAALASYFQQEYLPQDRAAREVSFAPLEASFQKYASAVGAGSIQGFLRDPDRISRVLQSWPRWDPVPNGGQLFEEPFGWKGEERSYFLHLPTGYQSGRDRPPLIVDLFEGDDPIEYFQEHWQGDPLLEEVILLLPPYFPAPAFEEIRIPFWKVVRTPSGVPVLVEDEIQAELPKSGERSGEEWKVLGAIGEFFWDRFSVDEKRIFVGARGDRALEAARLAARREDFFAGLILFSGTVDETLYAENLRHTGVYAPDGGGLVETLRRKGGKVARGGSLSEWIQSTSLELYPESFDVVIPGTIEDGWGDAWWIKVYDVEPVWKTELESTQSPEELPGLRVSIDRDQNAIILEPRRVRSLRIHLNDHLLDLDQPITVTMRRSSGNEIEEKTLMKATVVRSLSVVLETVWYTGLRRRIFVNDLWVFIP